MNELDLIFDLHLRNDRQGPGSAAETNRAIDLARLDSKSPLAIADIGCGTGASSVVLATTLHAHVSAVDFSASFIERLRAEVASRGMQDHIEPIVGNMEALPYGDAQFDVIWSEGAIYNMGFAAGLRAWRRFIRPGGIIAVSEITWTTAHRPTAIEEHWTREYPSITTASTNLQRIEEEGYEPIGMFFLPRDCWEAAYYEPISAGIPAFLERHDNSDAARSIVAAEQAEMALYQEYGAWFGYAFYIARKINDA
ncbi:MAG: methyltransferase domain-containing protein [Planctomycetota bacterium]